MASLPDRFLNSWLTQAENALNRHDGFQTCMQSSWEFYGANALALMVALAAFVLLLVMPGSKLNADCRCRYWCHIVAWPIPIRLWSIVRLAVKFDLLRAGPPALVRGKSSTKAPNIIPVCPDLHDCLNSTPGSSQTHP